MFFVHSKVLDWALMPAVWLVLLLLAAVLDRRVVWRRRWQLVALAVAIIGTNLALANAAMLAWELPPVPLSRVTPHDAGVLLTGVANGKKSPHDRVYLSEGADRLLHTLWLYRAGRIRYIIISGGSGALQGSQRSEAAELAILLRLAAVPTARILIEDSSRNTHENALYTRKLLQVHPEIKSLVLITSAFHQRRAMGCFQKAGLQPTAFPAGFLTQDPSSTPDYWLLPNTQALERWSTLLHEMAGYFIYKLMGYC
ncbi:YdcF family protein [Hymenobacter sp. BT730]|uniref:YdcF family protein n=1 Tax=Hymenobacter sp. BT730 TaxID=3063332 RepID=UPI0026DFC193|nr:YdcF family protein [Hymenobacter sp. BT730]